MPITRPIQFTLALTTAAALAACGGGGDDPANAASAASQATTPDSLALDVAEASPAFHSLGEIDAPEALRQEPLTLRVALRRDTRLNLGDGSASGLADQADPPDQTILATRPASAVVHTPASVRSLYGMPALPANLAALTAAQRADLGAGQTIYIVGAHAGANLARDLNTFSTRFGLPTCQEVAIAVANPVPALPRASTASGCSIAIVNSLANGTLRSAAPAYNANWATEFAMDVQWAHATAPLARIVVIQADSALTTSLWGAISVANRMGPGVVSMSFGAAEANYVEAYESLFSATGMTYLAAAGDGGAQANWPAVGTGVLSVGGTTAWQDGSGRNELAWARSGGGFSQYLQRPAYQAAINIAGAGLTRTPASQPGRPARGVTDLSFNADPYTGQMTVVTAPGGTARWYSMGGTSIGAPQWAGVVAAANARRALAGLQPLGRFHTSLYGSLAGAGLFNDVTEGSNGSQVWARAGARYDIPTGWGTPKVAGFLAAAARLP